MFHNVCDGYTFDLINQGSVKVLLAHKLDNVRSNPYTLQQSYVPACKTKILDS